MPKDVVITACDDILFKIETPMGTIEVCGYWNFKCTGNIPSLVAGGLIKPDWCPGLPGNNKTSQTVLFEAGGPSLIYGNRKSKSLPGPIIVIKRISANKFEVTVPPTNEQEAFLSQMRENLSNKDKEIRKQKEEREYKELILSIDKDRRCNPAVFKDRNLSTLESYHRVVMNELSGEYEFYKYGEITMCLDEASMQEVICAGARLMEAIRTAKVVCRTKAPHLSLVK